LSSDEAPVSGKFFTHLTANEEKYVTFPSDKNLTVLVIREDEPTITIMSFPVDTNVGFVICFDCCFCVILMVSLCSILAQASDPKFTTHKIVFISDPRQPLTNNSPIMKRIKFLRSYKRKVGRDWIGPVIDHIKPRDPPKIPLWPADFVGQQHHVYSTALHLKPCLAHAGLHKVPKSRVSRTKHLCTPTADIVSTSAPLKLTLEVLSTVPKVFLIRDFLSSEEIDMIIAEAIPRLRSSEIGSTTVGAQTERMVDIRRSSTAWLPSSVSSSILHIFHRAADLLRIPRLNISIGNAIAEDLQVVRYLEGEKYDGHFDWGTFGHPNTRMLTLLMYLNDQEDENSGGETAFLNAPPRNGTTEPGFKVHGGKGNAILFYNLLEDGNGDEYTYHSSLPVRKGVKWLCNLWIWDPFFQQEHLTILDDATNSNM
jgi:prolyl 4-hydroxylase